MMTEFKPGVESKAKYRVESVLDAPIDQAFTAARDEQAMMQWVPNVKSIVYDHSMAAEPYGARSQRLVTMPAGLTMLEVIDVSEKPTLIAYHIPSLGRAGDKLLRNYRGTMNFETVSENRTRLIWDGFFDCTGTQRLMQPLIRIAMKRMIQTMANNINAYLTRR